MASACTLPLNSGGETGVEGSEDEHIKELGAVGSEGWGGRHFCVHCGQSRVKFVPSLTRMSTQVRLVAHVASSDVREIRGLAEAWPPKTIRSRFVDIHPLGLKDDCKRVYVSVLDNSYWLSDSISRYDSRCHFTCASMEPYSEFSFCCPACAHVIHWLLSKRTSLLPPMVEIIILFIGFVFK